MTRADTIINPSPLKLIDPTFTETWYWTGYGAHIVPSFGLHITSDVCVGPGPTASYTDVATDLDVDFTDATTSASTVDSLSWDFGDGNTSTVQNPSHTYAAPGTYTVCLIAMNGCGADTICNTVTVTCAAPTTSFANSATGLDVDFTDASTSGATITSWSWDFGDGNASTVQNPSHTYATGGTYTVCLIVTDMCGSDTACNVVVTAPDGVNENWMSEVNIYPVPVQNLLNITGLYFNSEYEVKVINALGQVVVAKSFNADRSISIDVTSLNAGVYQVVMSSGEMVSTKSILIKE